MALTLEELLLAQADNAVRFPDQVICPGQNGPYGHAETSIRVQGHWLITVLWAWRQTGERRYLALAKELAESIADPVWRPSNASFHHRNAECKDRCNGLIGQAWTLEALVAAGQDLSEPGYIQLAEEVFGAHPFQDESGLWSRLEIDGSILSLDLTFNHQLWFAACAAALPSALAKSRVRRFMDALPDNMTILSDGLIYHPITRPVADPHATQLHNHLADGPRRPPIPLRRVIHATYRALSAPFKARRKRTAMLRKSIGYHHFNTFAFSLLKKQTPDHPFWIGDPIGKITAYLKSPAFRRGLEGNRYGYPYNAPGFEVPWSLATLDSQTDEPERIALAAQFVKRQFELTFSPDTKCFERRTPDPPTLTARVYALTRLPAHWLRTITVQLPNASGLG